MFSNISTENISFIYMSVKSFVTFLDILDGLKNKGELKKKYIEKGSMIGLIGAKRSPVEKLAMQSYNILEVSKKEKKSVNSRIKKLIVGSSKKIENRLLIHSIQHFTKISPIIDENLSCYVKFYKKTDDIIEEKYKKKALDMLKKSGVYDVFTNGPPDGSIDDLAIINKAIDTGRPIVTNDYLMIMRYISRAPEGSYFAVPENINSCVVSLRKVNKIIKENVDKHLTPNSKNKIKSVDTKE
jgi:hypothetical protein